MAASCNYSFFDVRVVDSDANSYLHRDVGAVVSSIEHIKKQKYSPALLQVFLSFHFTVSIPREDQIDTIRIGGKTFLDHC